MKKFTIILGIVFVQLSLFAQIPTDSLVLYLPFNGNAIDESGNGNDGTINGATLTEDRFGNPNSAYHFNGTSDYIEISDDNSLDLTTNFTISVWYKTDDPNQINQAILGKARNSNELTGYNIIYHTSSDSIHMGLNDNVSNIGIGVSRSNYSSYWHHLVSVSTDSLLIYIDGKLIDVNNISISLLNSNNSLFIGCENLHLGRYFNGNIDNIRLYKKVLTPCEVRALYFEGEQISCSVYDTISVTDTLIIDAILSGINPPNNINTIKIYPNPAKTHIYINNGNYNSMNGYSVKIDNSLGQTVYNHLIDQQEFYIDLSDWTGNGTYFVYIIDNNSNIIEVKKIIIQ